MIDSFAHSEEVRRLIESSRQSLEILHKFTKLPPELVKIMEKTINNTVKRAAKYDTETENAFKGLSGKAAQAHKDAYQRLVTMHKHEKELFDKKLEANNKEKARIIKIVDNLKDVKSKSEEAYSIHKAELKVAQNRLKKLVNDTPEMTLDIMEQKDKVASLKDSIAKEMEKKKRYENALQEHNQNLEKILEEGTDLSSAFAELTAKFQQNAKEETKRGRIFRENITGFFEDNRMFANLIGLGTFFHSMVGVSKGWAKESSTGTNLSLASSSDSMSPINPFYNDYTKIAWRFGMEADAFVDLMAKNRHVVMALGGKDAFINEMDEIKDIYRDNILSMAERTETATAQLGLFIQSGINPTTSMLHKLKPDMEYFQRTLGISGLQYTEMLGSIFSADEGLQLLRSANEAERESIMDSTSARLKEFRAMGMLQEQMINVTKHMNKLGGETFMDRYKKGMKLEMFARLYGIKGAEGLARSYAAGPVRDPKGWENIRRVVSEASNLSTNVRGTSYTEMQENQLQLVMDKLQLGDIITSDMNTNLLKAGEVSGDLSKVTQQMGGNINEMGRVLIEFTDRMQALLASDTLRMLASGSLTGSSMLQSAITGIMAGAGMATATTTLGAAVMPLLLAGGIGALVGNAMYEWWQNRKPAGEDPAKVEQWNRAKQERYIYADAGEYEGTWGTLNYVPDPDKSTDIEGTYHFKPQLGTKNVKNPNEIPINNPPSKVRPIDEPLSSNLLNETNNNLRQMNTVLTKQLEVAQQQLNNTLIPEELQKMRAMNERLNQSRGINPFTVIG